MKELLETLCGLVIAAAMLFAVYAAAVLLGLLFVPFAAVGTIGVACYLFVCDTVKRLKHKNRI